jgi:hypothetical protein
MAERRHYQPSPRSDASDKFESQEIRIEAPEWYNFIDKLRFVNDMLGAKENMLPKRLAMVRKSELMWKHPKEDPYVFVYLSYLVDRRTADE